MLELKIEGQRKRGRPVKRWIDVVEEDMKKRGAVQQDAGYMEGFEEEVGDRTGQRLLAGNIHQNNKWMMIMF